MDCPRCQAGEIVQITTSEGPYYCHLCKTYWKGPESWEYCPHPRTLAEAEAQASEARGKRADT